MVNAMVNASASVRVRVKIMVICTGAWRALWTSGSTWHLQTEVLPLQGSHWAFVTRRKTPGGPGTMAEALETSRMRRIKQRLPPPRLQHTRAVTSQEG